MSIRDIAIDRGNLIEDDYDWANPNLDQDTLPTMFHGTHRALYEKFIKSNGLNYSVATQLFELVGNNPECQQVISDVSSSLNNWFDSWNEGKRHDRDAVHVTPMKSIARKYALDGSEFFATFKAHGGFDIFEVHDLLPHEFKALVKPDPVVLRLRGSRNEVISEGEDCEDVWHFFSDAKKREAYIQSVIKNRDVLKRILIEKRLPDIHEMMRIDALGCVGREEGYLECFSLSDAVQMSLRSVLTEVRLERVHAGSIELDNS